MACSAAARVLRLARRANPVKDSFHPHPDSRTRSAVTPPPRLVTIQCSQTYGCLIGHPVPFINRAPVRIEVSLRRLAKSFAPPSDYYKDGGHIYVKGMFVLCREDLRTSVNFVHLDVKGSLYSPNQKWALLNYDMMAPAKAFEICTPERQGEFNDVPGPHEMWKENWKMRLRSCPVDQSFGQINGGRPKEY